MVGSTFSHFRIIEELSQGGMGTVYKAEDTRLKRIVALKLLSARLADDETARERFEREAQAAAALKHDNVITIYEIGEYDQKTYISMEYVEGKSLRQEIDDRSTRQATMPFDEIVNVACQVCDGLSKAHRSGIIHRDIKPGNLVRDESGRVKILDFGLVKREMASRLTKERTSLGTIYYMSPEQILGEEVDHRTDIWSLGIVLFEMITGELPFKGRYEPEVIYFVTNRKHDSISDLRPETPAELIEIVERALKKDKADRYQNIDMMKYDLVRVMERFGGTDTFAKTIPMNHELESTQCKDSFAPKDGPTNILNAKSGSKLRRRIATVLSCASLLALTLFLIRSSAMKRHSAAEPRSIAIISFENRTNEKAYDYLQAAIPNLLITSLEQSTHLQVTTWERLHDLLNKAGSQDIEFIDDEIGLELCLMEDIDFMTTGYFTKENEEFVIDLRLVDVETGNVVRKAVSQGEGVGSILRRQIDMLSKEISHGAGVSDREVEISQLPIAEVTTSSMEAYNFFLRGREDWDKFYHENARQFLQRATGLDSTFAVAHLFLAWTYGALGNTEDMVASYHRAKAFAQRSTEKEQLYIEADYTNIIEKNPLGSLSVLKKIIDNYPKEKQSHLNLAFIYRGKGCFSQAIDECHKALQLDPAYGMAINLMASIYAQMGDYDRAIRYYGTYATISPGDANPFDCLAETYLRMGDIENSISKYKQALEVKPDFYESYWRIAYLYALKEDYTEALEWIEQFIAIAPSSGVRAEGYVLRGFYYYWLGDITQSVISLEDAKSEAMQVGNNLWTAYAEWMEGWINLDRGKSEQSKQNFATWHKLTIEYPLPDRSESLTGFYTSQYLLYLGLIELRGGQIDSVKSRLTGLRSLMNQTMLASTDWAEFSYNMLLAEKLIAESANADIERSFASTTLAMPPYMVNRYMLPYNIPVPCDVLARRHVQSNRLGMAIVEYERLITFDSESRDRRLIHPVYHYRLAKLYELRGSVAQASKQYEAFLKIWKNADSGAPEVVDASERLRCLTQEWGRR